MNKKRLMDNIPNIVVSSVINVIITITTIAGYGWNAHKSIMEDVEKVQNKSSQDLKSELMLMVNSKLEKEPASFQISDLGRKIEKYETRLEELEKSQKRLIEILTSGKGVNREPSFR